MDDQRDKLQKMLKFTEQNLMLKKRELISYCEMLERERKIWLNRILSLETKFAKLNEESVVCNVRVEALNLKLESINDNQILKNSCFQTSHQSDIFDNRFNDYVLQLKKATNFFLQMEEDYDQERLFQEMQNLFIEIDMVDCEHKETDFSLNQIVTNSNDPDPGSEQCSALQNLIDVLENKLLSKSLIEEKLKICRNINTVQGKHGKHGKRLTI